MAGKARSSNGSELGARRVNDPIDQHVGARVRMRRLMLGISQQRLASALGLTFQQIQKYEKGTNRVPASRLKDISEVLAVSPGFFFEGADPTSSGAIAGVAETASADYVTEVLSTSEGLTLIHAFTRIIDPQVRRKVVDLVVAFADSQAGGST